MFQFLRSAGAGIAAALTTLILTAGPAFAMVPPPDPQLGTEAVVVPGDPVGTVIANSGPGSAVTAAALALALLVGATIGYLSRRGPAQARLRTQP